MNCDVASPNYMRNCAEPAFLPFGSFAWFKRELAPTRVREIRTAIMVGGAVLCVIISMTLQVPELSVSAYMIFFVSKETKHLTTLTGLLGLIGATIGIGGTILLYKFTYGHPELRIPGMAVALFLGMWLSRALVLGPLGFIIGFVVAYSQSIGERIPSPELVVRASSLGLGSPGLRSRAGGRADLTVSAGRGEPACTSTETEKVRAGRASFICAGRVHQSRTRALRAQSHLRSDVLLHLLFGD